MPNSQPSDSEFKSCPKCFASSRRLIVHPMWSRPICHLCFRVVEKSSHPAFGVRYSRISLMVALALVIAKWWPFHTSERLKKTGIRTPVGEELKPLAFVRTHVGWNWTRRMDTTFTRRMEAVRFHHNRPSLSCPTSHVNEARLQ